MSKKHQELWTIADITKPELPPILQINLDTGYIEINDYRALKKYIKSEINQSCKTL